HDIGNGGEGAAGHLFELDAGDRQGLFAGDAFDGRTSNLHFLDRSGGRGIGSLLCRHLAGQGHHRQCDRRHGILPRQWAAGLMHTLVSSKVIGRLVSADLRQSMGLRWPAPLPAWVGPVAAYIDWLSRVFPSLLLPVVRQLTTEYN